MGLFFSKRNAKRAAADSDQGPADVAKGKRSVPTAPALHLQGCGEQPAFETLEERRVMDGAIGAQLQAVVDQFGQHVESGAEPRTFEAEAVLENGFFIAGDDINVEVYGVGGGDYDAFVADLDAAGLQVRAISAAGDGYLLAEGYMPIANVESLVTADTIQTVSPIQFVAPFAEGVAANEGEFVQLADVAKALYGIDGSGVTVGVISDSADFVGNGLQDSIASGDLPPDVQNVLPFPGSPTGNGQTPSDEGRAMLELIHDIAPGADLLFASGFGLGQQGFANAVDALVQAGADIIVDDLGIIEPYFVDGIASGAVTRAVQNNGVAYFSSAGNQGAAGFETITTFTDGVVGTGMDAVGGQFHDFDPSAGTDLLQSITVGAGQTVNLEFQWDNYWGAFAPEDVTADLDVLLFTNGGNRLDPADMMPAVFGGTNPNISSQGGTGQARESVTIDNSANGMDVTINLAVQFVGSSPVGFDFPTRFRYAARNTDTGLVINEGVDPRVSFLTTVGPGHNTNPNGRAVAAAPWFEPTRPEVFSSIGPVTRTFTPTGERIIPVLTLQQPTITGVDGVSTSVPGFFEFFGTSAAAPNVAAVAALMRSANPDLDPFGVYTGLELTATDIVQTVDGNPAIADATDFAAGGFDRATGRGLVNAIGAVGFANGGVLALGGTDGDDCIEIAVNPADPDTVDITINGVLFDSIDLSFATSLVFDGGLGDDKLIIRDSLPFENLRSVTFNGGPGDDTFIVAPSPFTEYFFNGGDENTQNPGDCLQVLLAGIDGVRRLETVPGTGTYLFDGFQAINFTDVEKDTALANQRIVYGEDAARDGQSTVRVYDGNGAVVFEINPFENYFGGVTVAVGDLTGDGIDDVAVAPARGRQTVVRLYDGVDGQFVREILPYDADFRGGANLSIADITGDGIEDLVVSPQRFRQDVRVFLGRDLSLAGGFVAYDESFVSGITVATGDVDGDGQNEIVTGSLAGHETDVRVFSGINGGLTTFGEVERFLTNENFGFQSDFSTGVFVAVADFDADGTADIAVSQNYRGDGLVATYDYADRDLQGLFRAFPEQRTIATRVTPIVDFTTGGFDIVATQATDGRVGEARRFRPDGTLIDVTAAPDDFFVNGTYPG